jgi:hypothetical protein
MNEDRAVAENLPMLDQGEADALLTEEQFVEEEQFKEPPNVSETVMENPLENSDPQLGLLSSNRFLRKKVTMTSTDLCSDDSVTFKMGKRGEFLESTNEQKPHITHDRRIVHTSEFAVKVPWYKKLFMAKPEHTKNWILESSLTKSTSSTDVLLEPDPPGTEGKRTYVFSYTAQEVVEEECSTYGKVKEFKHSLVYYTPKEAFAQSTFIAADLTTLMREQDLKSLNVQGQWSGQQVSKGSMDCLQDFSFILWPKSPWRVVAKARHLLKELVQGNFFNNLMTLCVLMNTIVLAIDHYGISSKTAHDLQAMNFAFTIIFAIELGLKLIGLGFKGYAADSMNYLDSAVVLLSFVEIIFLSGSSSFTALRALRIFRAFRVLRVARLFRHMQSMGEIMRVISSTISGVTYLAMLLLLFTVIFALIGMQVFGGKFDFPEGRPRANFDTFFSSFVTVFQILTMENWPDILISGMRSSAGYSNALYFVFWIFTGNYICLNLFLAILFDGFSNIPPVVEETSKSSMLSGSSELELLNSKKDQLQRILDESDDSESEDPVVSEEENSAGRVAAIQCEYSFFLFSKQNSFRLWCINFTTSRRFEFIILVVICISAIKLVWDTYLLKEPSGSSVLQASDTIDIIITVVFIGEMLLKQVALGFIRKPGSYLRDSWNKLDFLIVIVSIIELSVTEVSLSFVKILRLFRTLRPLRFISQNSSMRQVVSALLESLVAIMNVGIVLVILWIIFAILGVSLFSGKFYACEVESIGDQAECEAYGYEWKNADYNFDNIFQAMLTMFVLSSLECWPDIMFQGVDATDFDKAPKKDMNPAAALYFMVFITVVVFFFMNLFVGIIFMKFHQSKLNESFTLLLNKEQNFWVEIQRLIVRSKPKVKLPEVPKSWFRAKMHQAAKSKGLMYSVMTCIVLNMLVLSIDYYTASASYKLSLSYINLIFTAIFLLEAIIKLIGLGGTAYFTSGWNCFDFFVVVASLVDIVMTFLGNNSVSIIRVGPQLIRVLRVLRVSKLMRIVKSLETIENLIQILKLSLPAVMSVLSLLALVYFVFAILGVFLFNEISSGQVINEYVNFHDFGFALLVLLRVSTGEEWNLILFDCVKAVGYPVSVPYFVSFVMITTFILLNLFVMVVLQEYENVENNPDSALKVFKVDFKAFERIWSSLADTANPTKMHYHNVLEVLKELGDSLGLTKQALEAKGYIYLVAIGIKIDDLGYAYYNDVLYCVLKRKYTKNLTKDNDIIKRKIMENLENQTVRVLAKLRKKSSVVHRDINDEKSDPWIKLFYLAEIVHRWHNWTVQKKKGGSLEAITPSRECELHPGMNSEEED